MQNGNRIFGIFMIKLGQHEVGWRKSFGPNKQIALYLVMPSLPIVKLDCFPGGAWKRFPREGSFARYTVASFDRASGPVISIKHNHRIYGTPNP